MKKWFIAFFLSFSLLFQLQAAKTDSLRWSLLTCQPGQEIYQLFGHTALRCENLRNGMDVVFNYGLFNFNTPNFVMRFVKGETDYQLGAEDFASFVETYSLRGSGIIQQTLNLTADESEKLWNLLVENYKPHNRIYRYNYFYNNCTTQARDRIEQCIDGKVVYADSVSGKSFRSIIHEYTQGSEWDELGIDMLLGQAADSPVAIREQMFAPFYLSDFVRTAQIVSDSGTRPLILTETNILDMTHYPIRKGFILSPFLCALILLVITVLIVFVQVKLNRVFWGWDLLLYGAQGIAGIIIGFLMFFSLHPTVDSNWLFMLFNPIPLLYLPLMVWNDIKRKKDNYHKVNVIYLTIFILLMPFVRQTFNIVILPLALCLFITSLGHLIIYRKRP